MTGAGPTKRATETSDEVGTPLFVVPTRHQLLRKAVRATISSANGKPRKVEHRSEKDRNKRPGSWGA
jgi:hypothetical protein